MSPKNLVELTLFYGKDLICTLIGNKLCRLLANNMTEDFPTFSNNLLDINHASCNRTQDFKIFVFKLYGSVICKMNKL